MAKVTTVAIPGKERELLAQLKIAKIALSKIERYKGTGEVGNDVAEIAAKAKFNIKHYKQFTQSHDVEED